MAGLGCALLLLVASGCATQHVYPGETRARGEVALLVPDRHMHKRLYIERVDDVKIGLLRDRVAVLPGTHEVIATVALHVAGRDVSVRHRIEFEARAGRRYRLVADWGFYGPDLRVVDERDGVAVATAHWRPARPDLPPVGAGPMR